MDRLGENFEFMPLHAGLFEKVCGRSLTGEEEDLTFGQPTARDDGRFNTCHSRHDDVAD